MSEQIQQLKKDIAEIEAFKIQIERQQLTFPLDEQSKKNLSKDIVSDGKSEIIPFNLINYDEFVEVKINNVNYLLETSKEL